MKLATSCPSCGKAITLWRIMAAPTPFHLSCKACKSNLRLQNSPKGVIIAGAVIIAIVGIGLGLLWHSKHISTYTGIAITVAVASISELVASFYVIYKGELVAKDEPKDEPKDGALDA